MDLVAIRRQIVQNNFVARIDGMARGVRADESCAGDENIHFSSSSWKSYLKLEKEGCQIAQNGLRTRQG